jgi:hypothetical protein
MLPSVVMDSTEADAPKDLRTALIGGVMMTGDEWGDSIVTPAKLNKDSEPNEQKKEVEKPPPNKTLPKVMGWALAELTEEEEVEQKQFTKDILARVHAETAAAIAAEESEVHETCPMCNNTKTFIKVVNDADGITELIQKDDDPEEKRAGRKSARGPIGFKPAKRGKQ